MTPMGSTVTIIVPVYNAQDTLRHCVTSLTQQTWHDLEILLIDDGSTDDSARLCDELAAEDDRVHAIHQPNAGPGAARNKGIAYSVGEWIMFVDCDDELELDGVEQIMLTVGAEPVELQSPLAARRRLRQTRRIGRNPAQAPDMVSFDFTVYRHHRHMSRTHVLPRAYPAETGTLTGKRCLRHIYDGRIGNYVWAFCYRGDFLRGTAVRFPENIRLMEDSVFLDTLLFETQTVRCLPVPIYRYHIGERRTLGQTYNSSRIAEGFRAVQVLYLQAQAHGLGPQYAEYGFRAAAFLYAHIRADRGIGTDTAAIERRIFNHLVTLAHDNWRSLPLKRKIQYLMLRLHWYEPLANCLARRLRGGDGEPPLPVD